MIKRYWYTIDFDSTDSWVDASSAEEALEYIRNDMRRWQQEANECLPGYQVVALEAMEITKTARRELIDKKKKLLQERLENAKSLIQDTSDFKRYFRDLRKKRGIRQKDIAAKLDLTQQTVSYWSRKGYVPNKHINDVAIILNLGDAEVDALYEFARRRYS